MANVALVGYAIFAVADWVAVARSGKKLEYVAKPAALAFLLLYAAAAPAPSAPLITALAFSLLGDVYLMLPADLFLVGLVAFLFAHVGYVIEIDASIPARLAWLLATLVVSFPIAVRIIRSVDEVQLRVAIGLYMLVIALMVGSAVASGDVLTASGAILFFTSDTLIACNRFVRPLPWGPVAIIVTYHVGQLGLVAGLRS